VRYTVNLKNRLGQIQPNNRYLLHRHSPLRLISRELTRGVESRPRHRFLPFRMSHWHGIQFPAASEASGGALPQKITGERNMFRNNW